MIAALLAVLAAPVPPLEVLDEELTALVGPTVEDLAAIDAEWPVIAAELALVEAECAHLAGPSTCSSRRVRHARRAVLRALVDHINRPALIGARS